jgi:uroporphyrinogen-III decarboxylase
MSSKTSEMTPRERLLAVYRGETPDRVPAIADLSYWYAANGGGKFIPGHTDGANSDKIPKLLALHRQTGAAIHLNLGCFYSERCDDTVRVRSGVDGELYRHKFETPIGQVEEVRRWSDLTFSWPIVHHMVQKVEDLKVIRYIFEHISYASRWDVFEESDRLVGDMGLPLVQVPYTGMGFLISRYAGVERTVMLAADHPEEIKETVDAVNRAHEQVMRLMAEGPSQVLLHSDNLSSDVQSPRWLERFSGKYFRRMAEIAHEHGKPLVTHIDGRLKGLLRAVSEMGIDGVDAATPAPWGDITPRQCRDEAGPKLVLSGGVPPSSFSAGVPLKVLDEQIEAWLELRHSSPALIIAPGDQLPPDGQLDRVTRLVQASVSATY